MFLWNAHTAEFVKEIGKGFFSRAVCAATFSHDTAYVCAAGCDDKHSMGVWDVHTGLLVCETTLCNGIPPQIRSLVCAPDLQYTAFINSKHDGLNDCFVTSGAHPIPRCDTPVPFELYSVRLIITFFSQESAT